uniref:Uncharacterized protein n=1 Tax=Rhizophora mucronata TaxID=61149 RepID=A0A2P2KPQ9_RHIMU
MHKIRNNSKQGINEQEELRNNIISIVRQSEVLNQAGAASMKPRQLSDAIFDEAGSKAMNMLSDGVWEIIRSGDGMKNEIAQTVQSVYNKLVQPLRKEEGKSHSHDAIQVQNEVENKGAANCSGDTVDDNLSDSEPQEPPGFSLSNNHLNNNYKCEEELQRPMSYEDALEEMNGVPNSNHPEDTVEAGDNSLGVPPGLSADVEHKRSYDSSDEDPEVPPGFG